MSEWISLEKISDDLGISIRTIVYYKDTQDFPPVYRIGKRHLRVKSDDYQNWLSQRIVNKNVSLSNSSLEAGEQ
jgi:predicted DNA-binding transcriptional regulator AlpA